MRFQYTTDEDGNISNPQYIPYPFMSIGADREWYYEGYVKEIKLAEDKKSFTVITQSTRYR